MVELDPTAVALDDGQAGDLDALEGREPGLAGDTLPATPDGRALILVARVDDAGLGLSAGRAAHDRVSSLHGAGPQELVVSDSAYH